MPHSCGRGATTDQPRLDDRHSKSFAGALSGASRAHDPGTDDDNTRLDVGTEAWDELHEAMAEVETPQIVDLEPAPEGEAERLRALLRDVARYVEKAAPDGSMWCDEGGLADRIDAALGEEPRKEEHRG